MLVPQGLVPLITKAGSFDDCLLQPLFQSLALLKLREGTNARTTELSKFSLPFLSCGLAEPGAVAEVFLRGGQGDPVTNAERCRQILASQFQNKHRLSVIESSSLQMVTLEG